MNSDRYQWTESSAIKDSIRKIILDAGACKVGFSTAGVISQPESDLYNDWIDRGCHGEMSYLENHNDLRNDPGLLLEGAKTVISCAFDYRQPVRHKLIADYALGEDYHNVIRRRLKSAAAEICGRFGGMTRICVDSAPVRERYWAIKAGIGTTGLNGQLMVDGIGSKIFLAEILWTETVASDNEISSRMCIDCGACVKACPGQALDGHGGLDARKCLSYLTIEYRGELPGQLKLNERIYGCDICQDVCPLNSKDNISTIKEFLPSNTINNLKIEDISQMKEEDFQIIFGKSAVKRTKLSGLKRNAGRHDF